MIAVLVCWLLLINLVSLFAMGWDKSLARNGSRRIAEKKLLLLAVIGGSVGELAGIWVFHHKTRHPKFTWGVPLILAAQLAIAAFVMSRL